jgi:hypothetical protein
MSPIIVLVLCGLLAGRGNLCAEPERFSGPKSAGKNKEFSEGRQTATIKADCRVPQVALRKNKAGNNSLTCRLQPLETHHLTGAGGATFLCACFVLFAFFVDLAGLAAAGLASSAATAEKFTAANRAAIRAAIIFFMLVLSID